MKLLMIFWGIVNANLRKSDETLLVKDFVNCDVYIYFCASAYTTVCMCDVCMDVYVCVYVYICGLMCMCICENAYIYKILTFNILKWLKPFKFI